MKNMMIAGTIAIALMASLFASNVYGQERMYQQGRPVRLEDLIPDDLNPRQATRALNKAFLKAFEVIVV